MATRINVTRASLPPFEEYIQEIAPLWNSHWLTNMGEKHQQLEARLAQYLQVPQVSLFSNGHLALELMLQAFHLKGEVITTPFSFASTTHAIVRNGLTPVFADVDPDDCTLDPACVEAAITPNTCAILPVHVYGNPCHVEELQAIADAHGLKLLYDSAHAFGVTYKGRGIAEYGDASMFSFHATKVFNTIEGGAVTCKDPALYHTLYQLKNFGIADAEHVNAVGANSKMNEVQAAMGLCNLRHLDEALASRKAALERYLDHLTGVPGVKVLLRREEDIRPNYAYLPVAFDPDAVFGTHVATAENDDWLSVYAAYDLDTGQPCSALDVTLVCGDGNEFSFRYPLTEPEQAALLEKMDACCLEQAGMALADYRARYLAEAQQPRQAPGLAQL